jgi:hypothetical protein
MEGTKNVMKTQMRVANSGYRVVSVAKASAQIPTTVDRAHFDSRSPQFGVGFDASRPRNVASMGTRSVSILLQLPRLPGATRSLRLRNAHPGETSVRVKT